MDQEALINAMTAKGHSRETALGTIAGRGYDEMAREYLGTGSNMPSSTTLDLSSVPSALDFEKGLQTTEDTALNQLLKAMEGRQQPLDIYKSFETEAGLPAYREVSRTLSGEIANLEDIISGIPKQISDTTRESIITQGQRENLIQAKRQPQVEALVKLSTNLGRVGDLINLASQGVITKTQLAVEGAKQGIEPYQLKMSVLADRNARLSSGFQIDRSSKLDELFAKFTRQNQLDDAEWGLANQLASEERNYLKELQTTAASLGAKLTGNEDANTLLTLIGQESAKQLAKTGGGTEGEREAASERGRLKSDVSSGATFKDVVLRYGDTLSSSEIRSLYNSSSRYGPATEPESTVQSWLSSDEGESNPSKFDVVRGNVMNLMSVKATTEDINTYIQSNGFSVSQFSDLLSGYQPNEKKKLFGLF